jgi:hypothetical protein
MEGMIDIDGVLHILRKKEMKKQYCANDSTWACSDICALFSDPIVISGTKKCNLQLCQKVLNFNKFEDLR